MIESGISVAGVKSGTFPTPEPRQEGGSLLTGSIDSVVYAYLGVVGNKTSSFIGMGKAPQDIASDNAYLYSVSSDGKYFQVATTLEKPQAWNM